ncbi:hypothetical protein FRB90_000235 [Tulasnella sp. 427]|nr:hypothetical protein FRB90_000235 [Tulasnella sp. 427]
MSQLDAFADLRRAMMEHPTGSPEVIAARNRAIAAFNIMRAFEEADTIQLASLVTENPDIRPLARCGTQRTARSKTRQIQDMSSENDKTSEGENPVESAPADQRNSKGKGKSPSYPTTAGELIKPTGLPTPNVTETTSDIELLEGSATRSTLSKAVADVSLTSAKSFGATTRSSAATGKVGKSATPRTSSATLRAPAKRRGRGTVNKASSRRQIPADDEEAEVEDELEEEDEPFVSPEVQHSTADDPPNVVKAVGLLTACLGTNAECADWVRQLYLPLDQHETDSLPIDFG